MSWVLNLREVTLGCRENEKVWKISGNVWGKFFLSIDQEKDWWILCKIEGKLSEPSSNLTQKKNWKSIKDRGILWKSVEKLLYIEEANLQQKEFEEYYENHGIS